MNQKYSLLAIAILAVLLVLCLITLTIAGIAQGTNFGGSGDDDNTPVDDINTYTIGATQAYTVAEHELLGGTLAIVNKNHKFNYIPSGLEVLYEYRNANTKEGAETAYKTSSYEKDGDVKVTAETAKFLHNMLTDLYANTKTLTYVATGYRSFAGQTNDKPAASGYSDFHTGMLVSLKGYVGTTTLDVTAEENADMYQWLLANAHKYGFIQRYPAGKEAITGVSDYLSCFRYVGVVHATYMNKNNLCLEEYVELISTEKPTVDNPMRVEIRSGSQKGYYAIYFCESTTEIQVPKSGVAENGESTKGFTVSGTNMGGVIVTVKLK